MTLAVPYATVEDQAENTGVPAICWTVQETSPGSGLYEYVPLNNPGGAGSVAQLQVFDGADSVNANSPTTFFGQGFTAAGANTVVDPAPGARWRLLGYMIEATGNAATAAAGMNEITLAGGLISHQVYIPDDADDAINGVLWSTGYRDLGFIGILGAIDALLTLTIGTALTRGEIVVNVQYTIEGP